MYNGGEIPINLIQFTWFYPRSLIACLKSIWLSCGHQTNIQNLNTKSSLYMMCMLKWKPPRYINPFNLNVVNPLLNCIFVSLSQLVLSGIEIHVVIDWTPPSQWGQWCHVFSLRACFNQIVACSCMFNYRQKVIRNTTFVPVTWCTYHHCQCIVTFIC